METKNMNVIEYVSPEVELMEVTVEAGYAGSGTEMGGGDGMYPPSGD